MMVAVNTGATQLFFANQQGSDGDTDTGSIITPFAVPPPASPWKEQLKHLFP